MAARRGQAVAIQTETQTMLTGPAIEWIHLDHAAPDALRVGDVVSAAAGGLPTYRVVALADQQAWVRDDDHAATRLVPINRLHWKMGAAPGER